MGFLQGKKILITGMISERSIAYGIAKACREQGAELAFTYVVDKLEERVRKMAAELDSELVFRCDVASDDEINQVFADLGKHWDGLDGLVHSIGFAPKEALSGDFLDSISREAFNTAHEISAYSLPALAKAARPMMRGRNSAIVALSYLGAVRAIPNYNVMGMAKASLEAGIRFTAACLGKEGIRCNGISASTRSKRSPPPASPISANSWDTSPPTTRCAATLPSKKSGILPPSCCPTCRPALPAKSLMLTAVTASMP